MGRVVYRGFVEHDEILIDASTPCVETRAPLPCRFHSGKELDGLHDIPFSKQDGDRLNFTNFKSVGAHLRRGHILVRPFPGHDNFIESDGLGSELEIQRSIVLE